MLLFFAKLHIKLLSKNTPHARSPEIYVYSWKLDVWIGQTQITSGDLIVVYGGHLCWKTASRLMMDNKLRLRLWTLTSALKLTQRGRKVLRETTNRNFSLMFSSNYCVRYSWRSRLIKWNALLTLISTGCLFKTWPRPVMSIGANWELRKLIDEGPLTSPDFAPKVRLLARSAFIRG